MKIGLAVALALAGCSREAPPPSCAARVATLAKRLAAERSLDEIRATASPRLRTALDGVAAGGAQRMAGELEALAASCPPLLEALGGVGAVAGSKSAYLRAQVPPAIEACACQASPEDFGGQLEVLLSAWRAAPTPR